VPFAGEKFPSPALKKARSENAYNELWDIMSARANLSFFAQPGFYALKMKIGFRALKLRPDGSFI